MKTKTMLFKNSFAKCVMSCACLAVAAGCGTSDGTEIAVSVEDQAAVESADELKALLTEIQTSGEGGSATAGVRTSIESLTLDEKLKASLLKDADALGSENNPKKVKAIAKRMAEQL